MAASGCGEIAGKTVGCADRGKGVEANRPGDEAVFRCGGPNYDVRPCFLRHALVSFD